MPVIVSGAGGVSEKKIKEIIESRGVVKSVQRGTIVPFVVEGTIRDTHSLDEYHFDFDGDIGVEIKFNSIELSPIDPSKSIVIIDGFGGHMNITIDASAQNVIIASNITDRKIELGASVVFDKAKGTSLYFRTEYEKANVAVFTMIPTVNKWLEQNHMNDVKVGDTIAIPPYFKVGWQVIEFY